jgi:hypothetical protein
LNVNGDILPKILIRKCIPSVSGTGFARMSNHSLDSRNFPPRIQVLAIDLSVRSDRDLILLLLNPLGHCEIRVIALERLDIGASYAECGLLQETSNRVGCTLVHSREGSELVDSIVWQGG